VGDHGFYERRGLSAQSGFPREQRGTLSSIGRQPTSVTHADREGFKREPTLDE